MLTEKSSAVDNDLVASSGRRRVRHFRIGNRLRHCVQCCLVRLTIVLNRRWRLTRRTQRLAGTSVAEIVEFGSAGLAWTPIPSRACRSRKKSSRVCQRFGWSRSHSFRCDGDNLPMKKSLSVPCIEYAAVILSPVEGIFGVIVSLR